MSSFKFLEDCLDEALYLTVFLIEFMMFGIQLFCRYFKNQQDNCGDYFYHLIKFVESV